jgi:hypothetical protein
MWLNNWCSLQQFFGTGTCAKQAHNYYVLKYNGNGIEKTIVCLQRAPKKTSNFVSFVTIMQHLTSS